MGNLVAWAVIGGVVALLFKRGIVAVLMGTIIAVIGSVVSASVFGLAAAGLLNGLFAGHGQAPSRAGLVLPEVFCGAVAAACAVSLLLLLRAVATGRIWPRGW